MELLSGYSDAGVNAFNANQNMIGNNLMNNINNQMAAQNQMMAASNAASVFHPTPYGYGFVGGYPSFGPAAAPGTYSPGSGLSSFSGVSLPGGGGGGGIGSDAHRGGQGGDYGGGDGGYFSSISNSWVNPGASAFNSYGLPGGGGAGSFSPSPNYPGGSGGGQSFNDMWSGRGIPAVARDNSWFNAPAFAQQMMPQYDFLDRFRGMQSPGGGGGGIGSDAAAAPGQPAIDPNYSANYLRAGGGFYGGGMAYGQPSANPSYFNPATFAGAQGNYGIPFNGQPMAGDIGFGRQPSYPNLGYNPGMANQFANPGMSGGAFQDRFGMGFPNAGTPSQVMPNYGHTLTPEDQYLRPHMGFTGSAETGGGGA